MGGFAAFLRAQGELAGPGLHARRRPRHAGLGHADRRRRGGLGGHPPLPRGRPRPGRRGRRAGRPARARALAPGRLDRPACSRCHAGLPAVSLLSMGPGYFPGYHHPDRRPRAVDLDCVGRCARIAAGTVQRSRAASPAEASTYRPGGWRAVKPPVPRARPPASGAGLAPPARVEAQPGDRHERMAVVGVDRHPAARPGAAPARQRARGHRRVDEARGGQGEGDRARAVVGGVDPRLLAPGARDRRRRRRACARPRWPRG